MFLALSSTEIEKYGVFAAMVAVAGMITASVAGLAFLWRGPLGGWEVPEQPKIANRLVTLPSAFLIVAGFFFSTPERQWIVLIIGGVLSTIAVCYGIKYSGLIMEFRRYKQVVAGNGKTKKVPVLAGDELTEWAKNTMAEKKIDEDACFSGTPHTTYNSNQMWPLASRVRVYKRMVPIFIITLFCGTGALSWLAYAVEVRVTGKAASQVLHPSQIPTGSDSNTQTNR